ncbi:aminotransferase class IV [Staphylococcus lutrae]|uniref:aminotransferase class IV n=1 Tax=Staphylococcus lutrae TaxID=155085 RepID=UPI001FD3EA1B|nr:aminotransferase class IV [Staphylococcus lutrae]
MNLFETMRLDNGHFRRLDYHLQRIQRASTYFNIPFDLKAWQQTIQQFQQQYRTGQYRVKMILEPSGVYRTEIFPLQETTTMTAQFVPMHAQVPQWQRVHKTSERQHLVHSHATQMALFYDAETHKVLEFDIGNVVLEMNGQAVTPVYDHDFLQGCMRQALLTEGRITEAYITTDRVEAALNQGGNYG